jgi:Ca2+-binding RTX toxin-like protein
MTGSWIGTTYIGDDSNDVATGTDVANTMIGNKGDDNLNGAGGDDALDGGVGSDDLFGGAGNDRLWDFSGAPFGFTGLIGHDTLRGGDGDDHVNVWSPDTGDVANGGAGFDTLEVRFNYNGAVADKVVSFVLGRAPSVVQYDGINTVAVSQIENMLFVSGEGNDFITGGEFNDTIAGQGGNDFLDGGDGDDVLEGGKGIQDIQGGRGFDRASFDLSDVGDALAINSGRNISLGAWGWVRNVEWLYEVFTGGGNDQIRIDQADGASIYSGSGADRITLLGLGGDHVESGQGDDRIDTGDGADFVDPGYGADVIHLGAGDDQCDYTETGTRSSPENDRAYGEDGDDRIYLSAGADLLDGGLGDDVLYGGQGGDIAGGGDGNDDIEGEGGADRLDGGAGDDVIGADYDYWTGEPWIDNDRVTGGDGNDTLQGGTGRDVIDGGAGDDKITLAFEDSSGNLDTARDEALAGDGVDLLEIYGDASATFKVVLGPDMMIKADGKSIAHAVSFERLFYTAYNSSGDHVITAGEMNDSIATGAGDSVLRALGGADTLYAGAGSDTVLAGDGADGMTGFIGGADHYDLGRQNDTLVLYDYLSQADLAAGGGGALYKGGAGKDTIELWLTSVTGVTFDGQDIRYNGTVIGTVTGFETIKFNGTTAPGGYNGSAAADYINLMSGDNVANGNGGADTIVAASGADTLNGGAGDDRITGGGGADRLSGGADADTFIYTALSQSAGAAIDLITDFAAGDKIDLSAIDADTVLFGNQAFHLGGGGGHAGDIVVTYDSANHRTVVDLYVNNDATVDGTIWLSGNHAGLAIGDFVA